MPPAATGGHRDDHTQHDDRSASVRQPPASRQVNFWFEVHLFAAPLIGDTTGLAWPGTVSWFDLDDADKVKTLIRAGVLWTLHEDTRQCAMNEAAQAIRDSENWAAIARRQLQAEGVYIPRRVS